MVAILNDSQKEIHGTEYAPDCRFNIIKDGLGRWVVSEEEIAESDIDWLKELPLIEYIPAFTLNEYRDFIWSEVNNLLLAVLKTHDYQDKAELNRCALVENVWQQEALAIVNWHVALTETVDTYLNELTVPVENFIETLPPFTL